MGVWHIKCAYFKNSKVIFYFFISNIMKNIVVYSEDSNYCLSLLMYLQNDYSVTTTTNLNILKMIAENVKFDLVILDVKPSNLIENFCKELNEQYNNIPILLTYVYEKNYNQFDLNIRKYINSIFYKPVDLPEVSKYLTSLLN